MTANLKRNQELEEVCESLKRENENLMKKLNAGEDLNDKISKAMDETNKIKLDVNKIKAKKKKV